MWVFFFNEYDENECDLKYILGSWIKEQLQILSRFGLELLP